ncbi:MAG TPA: hypothetical protein VIG29_07885 [Vicinamibacteria bacterium]
MRQRQAFVVFALTVFSISWAPTDRSPDAKRPVNHACSAIQVSSASPVSSTSLRQGGSRKKTPTFSAAIILDLRFESTIKGSSELRFDLYTPRGHLYQSLPATTAAPSASERQRGEIRRKATATLPVAGTTIVTSSLYGAWKVEAFLKNEQTTACASAVSFVISP